MEEVFLWHIKFWNIAKKPNKKIASISRYAHAKLIGYYLKRENLLELKRKIYSIMYFMYIRNNFNQE